MDPELVSERVRLRPFVVSDTVDVFTYASNSEVTRYLDWRPHRSLRDSERVVGVFMQQRRMPVAFAIEHRATQRVIGSFEIRLVDPVRRVGEIGYALAPAFWGQGYNLEAGHLVLDYGFSEGRLLRIQGLCDVGNRRSYRTMEKLGMVRERLLPHACVRNGRHVDRFMYGLLWREWAGRMARDAAVVASEHESAVT